MTDTTNMTETELADYYDRTGDLSEFEDGQVVQIQPGPKSVVVSVRFATGELEAVERQAEEAGMKLTAFIRASALSGAYVVDLDRLRKVAAKLVADSQEMGEVIDLPTGQQSQSTSNLHGSGVRSGRTGTFQKSSRSAAASALARTAPKKAATKAAATKAAATKAAATKAAATKAAATKAAASKSTSRAAASKATGSATSSKSTVHPARKSPPKGTA